VNSKQGRPETVESMIREMRSGTFEDRERKMALCFSPRPPKPEAPPNLLKPWPASFDGLLCTKCSGGGMDALCGACARSEVRRLRGEVRRLRRALGVIGAAPCQWGPRDDDRCDPDDPDCEPCRARAALAPRRRSK